MDDIDREEGRKGFLMRRQLLARRLDFQQDDEFPDPEEEVGEPIAVPATVPHSIAEMAQVISDTGVVQVNTPTPTAHT